MLRLIMPLVGDGDDHEPPARYALVELDQRAIELTWRSSNGSPARPKSGAVKAMDLAGYPGWQPVDEDHPEVCNNARLQFDTESVCWLVFGDFEGMTMPLTWHQLAIWAG